MLRLSVELPDVTHAIFAMNGAPGLMTDIDESGELIPLWDKSMTFTGFHSKDIDVTGGIYLKVERASSMSEAVEHVWLVDATQPSRIIEIVENGHTIGTRFVA